MSERPRRPIKVGYYTVPENVNEPPRLMGTKCGDCGEYFFPQRKVCAKCLSENTAEALMGPGGTLYSYTFVHLPMFGASDLELSQGYGVGQVDLPEGPRVQFPLAGKQEDFKVGMPLVAELKAMRQDGDQDVVILRFKPVEGGAR